MTQLSLTETELTVPTASGRPLVLDMRKIHKAEARIQDLATVTKSKSMELQACFIEGHAQARDHYASVKQAFGDVKQKLRTVKGLIILDRAAAILKAKDIASSRSPGGSEDQREAVINTDPEYLEWVDVLSQVEAAMDRMDAKVDKLNKAYFSALSLNKTMDPKRDVSGGVGDDDVGAPSDSERTQTFIKENSASQPKGFGKARF